MKNKILLLEDDEDLSEVVKDYFATRGYQFTQHTDGEVGLKEVFSAISQGEEFDVILTDFQLPKMNGLQLIEEIRKVAPHTPILLMTACASVDFAIEAIDKGAFDFVVKPIQFPQLSISLERAVRWSRLQRENLSLKSAVQSRYATDGKIIAKSPRMRAVLDLSRRVATSQSTVLITGESGSGKEVIARYIHNYSTRKDGPFIAINCSAIPENLLESELFGHAKGSFTGAEEKRLGLFEEAAGGTLFLDEIGDLSLPLQAKLLRVIQDRKIKRVGENQYRDVNVRLLAATHKNLEHEVSEKRFREDLFFRLNVIPVRIPSLQQRPEDILPLAEQFLETFKSINSSKVKGFSKEAMQVLLSNPWRGNVRELENSIERAVVLCEKEWVEPEHFLNFGIEPDEKRKPEPVSFFANSNDGEMVPLSVIELRYIKHVLDRVNGVKDSAAKILQVDRKTLYRKLELLKPAIDAHVPQR